jgi:hypothetical protein
MLVYYTFLAWFLSIVLFLFFAIRHVLNRRSFEARIDAHVF